MALLVTLVAAVTTAGEAGASWSVTTAPDGEARANSQGMTSGQQPSAVAQPSNGNEVEVSWAASTGGPVAGYEVFAHDADTEAPRAVDGTCAGVVTATSCTDLDVPDGRWTYSVRPRSGEWAGTEGARSEPVWVDTVAPVIVVEFPAPGGAYNAANWDVGCDPPGFCGSGDDAGSGLAGGGVSLQQVSTGLYWDGTAFASPVRLLLELTGATPGYNVWGFPIDDFADDGRYTEQAIATDAVGNTTTSSVTFTIDREGIATAESFPAPDGIYGTELWNSGCPTPGFCATGEVPPDLVSTGGSVLQEATGLYWDGTAFTGATEVLLSLGTDGWPFPITNFAADGAYTARVVFTDIASNETVYVVPFAIDRVAPTLVPTFPVAGAAYTTAAWDAGCTSPGICAVYSDDTGPVASAFVTVKRVATFQYWNGTAFATYTETALVFDVDGLALFPAANFPADGTYQVGMAARDLAGNSTSSVRTITIDESAPTVSITHPQAAGTYGTATWDAGCAAPGACAAVADATSSLATVGASLRHDATGTYWNGSTFTGTTETFSSITGGAFPFAAADFPADGDYTVRVEAADFAGHSAADEATFTIDRVAPTVALTFPTPGTYNATGWPTGCPTPGICGTAADDATGIAAHAVSIRQGTGNYWNGTAFASATEVLHSVLGTGSLAFPDTNFPTDVAYTVRATTTDGAGNTATTSTTFTLNRAAPRTATAYVANRTSGTVTPINTATNTASTAVATGSHPRTLAVSPDGATAYVINQASNNIRPINTTTGVVGTAVAAGTNAYKMAITPDGTTGFVTYQSSGTVRPVTLSTMTFGAAITVGSNPTDIAITPDGVTAFVTNFGSNTVTPITVATRVAGTPITIGPTGTSPRAIAITPDGVTAFVTNQGSTTVTPFTVATRVVGPNITVGSSPFAIAITPDGATAYVAVHNAASVTPITVATRTALAPIALGAGTLPHGIAVAPDGVRVYVTNEGTNTVTPITVATNTAGTPIPVGTLPNMLAIVPDQAPVATFTAQTGTIGSPVGFNAAASTVAYGTIATYAWDFGDGTTATTTSPATTHTYTSGGTFTARVTETSSAGTSTSRIFTGQTVTRNGGPSATTTRSVTIGGLAVATTFPAPASTYGTTSWNAGCTSGICGTTTGTGPAVTGVQVSVRQGTGNYWNGTAFASATEVLHAATGTTTWTLAFPASNLATSGAYTVRAVATDAASTTATASTVTTIDKTAPAPTAMTFFNANGTINSNTDEVRITYSESLEASTICSAWTGTGDQVLNGSGVVVTITDQASNDAVSATATACTLHIGTIPTARQWTTGDATFSGSTTATESRITWTAATNTLTIHLGTKTGAATLNTNSFSATATYNPDAAITDRFGNPISTTPFNSTTQRF